MVTVPPGEQQACSSSAATTTAATATTTPFEWLTSPESLQPTILAALQQQQQQTDEDGEDDDDEAAAAPPKGRRRRRRILHVGCGSSTLGELLVAQAKTSSSGYRSVGGGVHLQVVNVDKDADTLRQMRERWHTIKKTSNLHDDNDDDDDRMLFECVDFARERGLHSYDSASFDLVLDKSTLDCLLCTDRAAAGLLAEVYRVLKPGGVYLLVSFHDADAFLRPLLANLPGADWMSVADCVLPRQVEDLVIVAGGSNGCSSSSRTKVTGSVQQPRSATSEMKESDCKRTVNVFQCRKRRQQSNAAATATNNHSNHDDEDDDVHQLDWNAVYHHVHDTNDRWFRQQNPLLTEDRRRQIREAFIVGGGGDDGSESSRMLALRDAYSVLFTDAEREHLDYEGFLQDWRAFCATNNQSHDDAAAVEVDRMMMSADEAIAFLDEMQ